MTKEYRHEMGPEGHCICPKCGKQFSHERGIPCQEQHCPSCGAKLLREGSHHHNLFLAKHGVISKKENNDSHN
jgi:NAD-dependent SIR2 family protein deacetylase